MRRAALSCFAALFLVAFAVLSRYCLNSDFRFLILITYLEVAVMKKNPCVSHYVLHWVTFPGGFRGFELRAAGAIR